MYAKEVVLTYSGLEKLESELEFLKTVKRKEVAARIKAALHFGNLAENSEYDEAKNQQAFIEGRILTLEKLLRNALLIKEGEVSTETVSLGCTVILKELETCELFEFTIVGSVEADPGKNKISNESPVGRAIIGKAVGSVVEVEAPVGKITYKIKEIKKVKSRELSSL
ncbi:MAG: transcription elongation factor GreA [Candidatus Syntrophonatronum acetioxidans]|uniref:Transcription elongation factor GreA n=1 Tax=Candidatus Syntrophonatronum acetioxidans TaxID=1795816 RepID=A0A424YGN6_9FIRM|nr:MAG: transcription elongation factor GreA [Candidatus Syntrophonatronum acetioxidans]